ncbi:hypothetical protein FOZ60_012504 [Perkinsus olseni]|uniref:Uncharacterized protein n=1 Tax=Perkinsus olseni TaxID=32597 RepID=A0A7J6PB32_PEROL|nr:hypothetical protein FOZ60_012504 [Perkinsus olseni]
MPDSLNIGSSSKHHVVDLLSANSGVRFLIASFLGPTELTRGLFATCEQLHDLLPISPHATATIFRRNALLMWPLREDESPVCDICDFVAAPDRVGVLDTLFITCLHNPQALRSRNTSEDTPLLVASKYSRVRTIRLILLLEKKLLREGGGPKGSPLVEDVDNCSRNALHLCPNAAGIGVLLDAGCNVFKLDDLQRLPIAWAQRRGADAEVMELLSSAMKEHPSSRRQFGCLPFDGCIVQ